MAKNTQTQDKKPESAEEAPPKKGKLKLLLIAGIATVMLAAGGGGAWYFLMRGGDAHATQAAAAEPPQPPVFLNLEPFTVNLQPEAGEQYLQVVAVLRLADAEAANALKVYMPEVRHKVLLLLSGKKASAISSVEGREALAGEIRDATNRIVASATGKTEAAPAAAEPAQQGESAAQPPAAGEQAQQGEAAAQAPATGGQTAANRPAAPVQPPAAKPKAVVEGPVKSVLFTSFIVQ